MASVPAKKTNVKAIASWGLGIACVALVFGVLSFAYIASTYKTATDVVTTTKSFVKSSAHALSKVDDLERAVASVIHKLRQPPPPPPPPAAPAATAAPAPPQQQHQQHQQPVHYGAAPPNFGWSGGKNPDEMGYEDSRGMQGAFYS